MPLAASSAKTRVGREPARTKSDNPQVATIDQTTGRVTGVGNGRVAIWAENEGERTTRLLRGLPSYGGSWVGNWIVERRLLEIDIGAVVVPLEKGNHRAGVSGDQRQSSRRRLGSSENLTEPRSRETRRNVPPAAIRRRPCRIVSVMPSPVAFCARSSSSSGTWTVILRSRGMPAMVPAFMLESFATRLCEASQ